ncbi:MAG: glycosyltransferase family 2 protein [Thermoanaerobaculia bacterium]|nr:glycosyltransferase family 2 protein [Thermoanaerobaculia bacterium]
MSRPRVTVAIPLYRSARFVDNVSANIESLSGDVEILVSDRHQDDDAVDRLERRHASDPRVHFLRHRDGVGWVDHINALLLRARGKYWRFMPHDDFASGAALEALVRCLDEYQDSVLAYGPTTAVDLEGTHLAERENPEPHPVGDDEPWTLGLALDSLWRGHFDGAFKGLIRRDVVVERRLWIRNTLGDIFAERAWLMALACLGRFRFVPDAPFVKRFHPESTHARWRRGRAHEWSLLRVLCGYLSDLVPERRVYRSARHYLAWTTAKWFGWLPGPSSPLPAPTEPLLPGPFPGSNLPGMGMLLEATRSRWRDAHAYELFDSEHRSGRSADLPGSDAVRLA